MRFLRLDVQNFMRYRQRQRLDFTKCSGLTLIDGDNRDDATAASNGAGKSALINALVWCLFDRTLNGLSKDEVINSEAGKDCRVSLLFEHGGKRYAVVRHRKTEKPYRGSGVRLLGKGPKSDLSAKDLAGTQARINRLLGVTAETFVNTVCFGQSSAYRFSLLTDAQQKAILDNAIGIELYAQAGELARHEASPLRTAIQKHDQDTRVAEDKIRDVAETIANLRALEASFERDRQDAIAACKAKRKVHRKLIARLDQELEELDRKAATLAEARLVADQADAAALEASRRAYARQSQIDQVRTALAELREHVRAARQRGTGECQECGQVVTSKALRLHVGNLRRARRRQERALVKTVRRHAAAQKAAQDAAGARTEARDRVHELALASGRLTSARKERRRLELEVKSLDKELDRLSTKRSNHGTLIQQERAKRKALKVERGQAQKQASELRERLAALDFWSDAFGARGLRSLLIDNALPILNRTVQQYADVLTDGTIEIEFKTQSAQKSGKVVDRFDVAVTNKYGATSYRGNSVGERAKIDLCVALALQALVASRASTHFNVVFMDEVFDGLDSVAAGRVMDLMATIAPTVDAAFIITHSDAVRSSFHSSNVVTVVKENGESRIEQ